MADTKETTVEEELHLLKIREDELVKKNKELDSQLKQFDSEYESCLQSKDHSALMLDLPQRFTKPNSKGLVTPTSARSFIASPNIINEEATNFSKECCAFSPTLLEVNSNTKRNKTHRRSLPCTSIPSGNAECQERIKDPSHSALKAELEKTKHALTTISDEHSASQQRLQRQNKYVKKLENDLRGKQEKIDEFELKTADQQSRINELKREIQELQKEVASTQQFSKAMEADYKKNEARMSRALEECAKYKASLSKATEEKRQSGTISKEEKEDLVKQIKALEQQRRDMITAFKKQMKLIDILKRQKLCIEAAKVLSVAEEEFMKVINWEKVN